MSDAVYFLFFSHIPSIRYVFPNGAEAVFVAGRYATDDAEKIAHLTAEVKSGHPQIFIDPNRVQCTKEDLDPMAELRKQIIAEYEAKKAQEASSSTSDSGKLNPSSSADLVDVKSAEEKLAEAAGIKLPAKK